MLRQFLLALVVAMVFCAGSPQPSAAEPKTAGVDAESKASEAIRSLLEVLRTYLKSIPLYGPPELRPNGDIVIPRLNDRSEPDAPRENDKETEIHRL